MNSLLFLSKKIGGSLSFIVANPDVADIKSIIITSTQLPIEIMIA